MLLFSLYVLSVLPEQRKVELKYISASDLTPKLEKIKLPPDATKKQAEEYIDKILAVSKAQNRFSHSDIQIAMLKKVGHKYLPSLLSRMKKVNNTGPWNFHISLAIVSLVKETDKKQILKMLYNHPRLIDAVVKFGWQDDVKDIIFAKIKASNSLPVNWIACASQLAGSEDYETLKRYFVRTHIRPFTYNAIKDLPGIKLDDAVAKIWKANKYNSSGWTKKQCALIAVDFGYLDALEAVIELRNDRNRYFHRIVYDKMYSLTGQRGSYAKLKEWFAANKDKLFFDKKTRRYLIKGGKNSNWDIQVTPKIVKNNFLKIYSKSLMPQLKKIKLPPDADKKQTGEYIDNILAVSKKQTHFSRNDIQITMLKRINHKYLSLLIKRMDKLSDGRLFHLRAALNYLVRPSDKKMIIDNLSKSPGLIHVVMKFNWAQDAKEIIFKKLEDPGNYLHPAWVACAAKVAKPVDYKILINYFIENNNKQELYNIIKKLPGIKLDQAVETVWLASRWSSANENRQCALIAAEYGHIAALKTLVEMLDDSNWKLKAYKKIVLLTDQSGSKKKIKRWFNANKDKLFFDKTTKHYIINSKLQK